MILRKTLVVLIMFLFIFKINAQGILGGEKPADTASIGALALYDLKQGIKGVGYSFSRPFHWKKKDFTTLGTIALGTLALSFADEDISEAFIRSEPDVPNFFQEAGTRFGSPQVYFIANAGLYGFGLFTKNEKIRKTSVLIIASSFTTGLIQSFTKTLVGRGRPQEIEDGEILNSTDFRLWDNRSEFHSFPSGHTVLSITAAHAIAKQFKNPWSKVAVYSLGSVAPISRLFIGAHWLTDIAVSAVLSIAVVDAVDKFLFKTKAYNYDGTPKKEKYISWNFAFTGNQIGIIGSF